MSFRAFFIAPCCWLVVPSLAWAGVPTASLPLDDSEPTPTTHAAAAATPSESAPAPATSMPSPQPTATPTDRATAEPEPSVPFVPTPGTPTLVGPIAPAPTVPAAVASSASALDAINATPSALVSAPTRANYGFARVQLQLKEPGSTMLVFANSTDTESLPADTALVACSTNCSFELPHGEYAIRVVTAEGVASHGELSLHSARWVSVAPARRVVRDLGFAIGIVGAASTILGVALLSEAICETCTSRARNVGAAFGLGLGIPMVAMGWSLYFVHRNASVDEQILSQAARSKHLRLAVTPIYAGAALSGTLQF